MSFPVEPITVPTRVRALAGLAALTPVWLNNAGGVTFRTDDGRFIKHGPLNGETSLAAEAARLRWAGALTPVPRVLDAGEDGADEWLVTAAVPGRSAVDPRWVAEPATAVRAIGEGLRAMHDTLPVASCPYDSRCPRISGRRGGSGSTWPTSTTPSSGS
ncbi:MULTISPECIES: phosphotransferase [unclassified Microbacterium]|uniref:phosphotransferase n=1 Tax=unclassified Microbacterium TaxID=2609290 RepID=UPI00214B1183|nr:MULTISPECIES: phosphotransferase [unclassified Microbacterium]MCR2783348.1 phosphotransferase [Microbacterium sp. zg.B96]WIM15779.1 phosphotransferase [Microbacterium sp. zg-B96]